ncbi:protease complex subunit PrcB family protein [Massilia sp. IC2-476]|uniref:protease complex subunit PrcB family protein n=1 Tax=Massilia sp. IC2-476 TaxID=2887199 RepID=UPI001D1241BD|nr:protease complex subunit PrcB family protein [Massilia sp. IC2-476]MCC2970712.1 hypothetical protein [Massilia sp. IC2-476]
MKQTGFILIGAAFCATLAACGGGSDSPAMPDRLAGNGIAVGEPNGGAPVVSEFIKLAQDASCATTRNNLFVVDGKYVLWDRAGECADNAAALKLMGPTPGAVLCEAADGIAGPRSSCSDDKLLPLFDTMRKNVDKPDLGLGSSHRVDYVPFLPKPDTSLSFTPLVEDSYSKIAQPRQVVVRDAAAWAALSAEHGQARPLPEVDFSRHMLVGVFAGNTADACTTSFVAHIVSRGGKLVVEYVERDTSQVEACAQVVGQPMQIVQLARVDAPVEFSKVTIERLAFRTLDQRAYSRIATPRKLVVRDGATWAALWAEHAGATVVPDVDFDSKMVIGVFLGSRPSGCYGTSIERLTLTGDKLMVVHVDTEPGPGVACTQAFTSAAHLVVVDRSERAVSFEALVRTLK